jgi:hypothetical protein
VKAIATQQHWVSYAPNGSSSTIETGLAWLRRVVGEEELFKTLIEVGLVGHQITDAELVHLEGLAPLRRLYLGDNDVSDAGLVHLRGLTNLKLLNLRGTLVTDAGADAPPRVDPTAIPRPIRHSGHACRRRPTAKCTAEL